MKLSSGNGWDLYCADSLRWLTQQPDATCDPFTGAGTTAIAALLEGRRFVGVEMSEEYFAIATNRIRALGDLNYRKADPAQIALFGQGVKP